MASPWAEAGDIALRQDIELLADSRVIDGITTQWPLPWGQTVNHLENVSSLTYPDYVRQALRRVRNRAASELDTYDSKVGLILSATNEPSVIRGYGALGREELKAQLSAEWMFNNTAIRLSAGARTSFRNDDQTWDFDGSYIAQRLWDVTLYGGYVSHWWGPGWISALSLSDNARPFPQVGLSRSSTEASSWPILNWLGPWQAEFFVGVLDGPRIARNTLYSGLRVTVNPLPGLQIGAARTQELCGTGHPCTPLKAWTTTNQSPVAVNQTNDQGLYDIRYSNTISGTPFAIYTQIMFEDMGTITPIGVSHLYGGTVWLPIGRQNVRFTVEYANTVPTYNMFTFDDVLHGNSYNNPGYPDGMRYRDRTLGMSLDSDSELFSLQASWTDSARRSFTLTYHNAKISHPLNAPGYEIPGRANFVTSVPVKLNMFEVRATFPFAKMAVDLAARLQDDQPRPSKGFTGAVEASLRVGL